MFIPLLTSFEGMFFETRFLTKKAELAAVWLAAHWERKLSKQQVNAANIVLLVGTAVNPFFGWNS